MSRLIGDSEERWSLARAVDALAESARSAGKPGLIWAAGLLYPGLELTHYILSLALHLLNDATYLDLPLRQLSAGPFASNSVKGLLALLLMFLPLTLLGSRLVAGLAYVSGPEVWKTTRGERRAPALKAVWNAGAGLTLPAFGLWASIQVLTFSAVFLLLGPVVMLVNLLGLERLSIPLLVALSPLALLLFLYGMVLQVMNQLALHSLACNRRGAASALTHAWRLIQTSPWSVVRGGVGDLLLTATVSVIGLILSLSTCIVCVLAPLGFLVTWVVLPGFAGVTRAGYWARAYRELGGLTPADHMPGLQPSGAADLT